MRPEITQRATKHQITISVPLRLRESIHHLKAGPENI